MQPANMAQTSVCMTFMVRSEAPSEPEMAMPSSSPGQRPATAFSAHGHALDIRTGSLNVQHALGIVKAHHVLLKERIADQSSDFLWQRNIVPDLDTLRAEVPAADDELP